MFRSRCVVAGGALILSAWLAGQPAVAQDLVPRAQDSRDVTGDRGRHQDRRGDDRFVPPAPLFDEFGGDAFGGDVKSLDGGAGISTDPDLYFTDEREEFLEDGGGISAPAPKLRTLKYRRADRHRGWRNPRATRSTHRTSGSFTVVVSDLGDRRHLPTVSASLGFGAPGLAQGPKIIDVASERLDRRAIPPSGIEVINAGGPKIIRIAKDYDRTTTGAINATGHEPAGAMEPWSPAWLAWCSRNHPGFDPNLGTYRDAGGRSRFCTGD